MTTLFKDRVQEFCEEMRPDSDVHAAELEMTLASHDQRFRGPQLVEALHFLLDYQRASAEIADVSNRISKFIPGVVSRDTTFILSRRAVTDRHAKALHIVNQSDILTLDSKRLT